MLFAQPAAQSPKTALKIVVLQGDNATNDVKSRTAVEPVVEVRDQQDFPVRNATVTFQLPSFGPSGFFPDQNLTFKTITNAQGQAAATGLVPNSEAGRFTIKVTAMADDRIVSISIQQRNASDAAAAQAKSKSRVWKIVAIAGGLAATGGIALSRRGSSNSTPPPAPNVLTITPGPVSIGGPR